MWNASQYVITQSTHPGGADFRINADMQAQHYSILHCNSQELHILVLYNMIVHFDTASQHSNYTKYLFLSLCFYLFSGFKSAFEIVVEVSPISNHFLFLKNVVKSSQPWKIISSLKTSVKLSFSCSSSFKPLKLFEKFFTFAIFVLQPHVVLHLIANRRCLLHFRNLFGYKRLPEENTSKTTISI